MFTIKNSIVQELIEEYINEIEDELKTISCVELRYQKGSFIQTKESLMSEQEDWADGDEAKNIDFSQGLSLFPELIEDCEGLCGL